MDYQRLEGSARTGFKRLIKKLSRPTDWPKGALQVPPRQAHRGYHLEGARENTIEAFLAAQKRGATMCELDVRLTKDKVVVVFHDDTVERFTERKDAVKDLRWDELKQLIPVVPTLEEVLGHPELSKMKFNIESKSNRAVEDPLERKTFEVIETTESHGRVLISSFNPLSLWRFSLHTKNIPLALLVGADMDEIYLEDMWFAPFITFHALHLDDHLLTDPHEIRFWRDQGVPLSVWTVNDRGRAQELLDDGILSIISDEI